MWMTAASLSAWWLWRCGVAERRVGSYPFGPDAAGPAGDDTCSADRPGRWSCSSAACCCCGCRSGFRTRLFLAAPAARRARRTSASACRTCGPASRPWTWPRRWSARIARESLEYRFKCERLLADHAMQRPIFGWGGYGRAWSTADEEKTQAGPARRAVDRRSWGAGTRRHDAALPGAGPAGGPVRPGLPGADWWGDPRVAAASLAAALLGLYLVDCLMNAFVNIIYITLAGGLAGLDPRQLRRLGATGREAEATGRRAVGRAARSRRTRRGGLVRPGPAGGPLPHPGPVVQAGGAARRGGRRLAAGPRPARRPDRGRPRRRRAATAVVRLRQRPRLAAGQPPRPVPPRPGLRRRPGPAGGGRVPRRRRLLEHPGSRVLPRRRRSRGHRRPRAAPGPSPAARPSTTSSSPWPAPGRRPGGGPAGAGPRHAAGRAGPSGPPRAGRPLRRGPRPDRRRGAAPAIVG